MEYGLLFLGLHAPKTDLTVVQGDLICWVFWLDGGCSGTMAHFGLDAYRR